MPRWQSSVSVLPRSGAQPHQPCCLCPGALQVGKHPTGNLLGHAQRFRATYEPTSALATPPPWYHPVQSQRGAAGLQHQGSSSAPASLRKEA